MSYRLVLLGLLLLVVCACTTKFYGDPKVEGGPSGCAAKCAQWNMELAGMVAMGEYSDACICQVRGRQASLGTGAVGAIVAVDSMNAQQSQHHHTTVR
jgi:hypothetical protein